MDGNLPPARFISAMPVSLPAFGAKRKDPFRE